MRHEFATIAAFLVQFIFRDEMKVNAIRAAVETPAEPQRRTYIGGLV
jgi:hypothetical protein